MNTSRILVGAGVAAAITASAFAIGPKMYPTLGSMGSGGASVTCYFDVNALATSGDPDFVGAIANSSAAGIAFDGVVIRVTAKEPTAQTTHPPTMVKTTLARGERTLVQDVGPTAVAYGESSRHESFPGGPLKANESVDLRVDLKTLGPEDVLVTTIPLVADKPKGSKSFASMLDEFAVDAVQPTQSHETECAELDRIAFPVTNHDERARLSAIEGRVIPGLGANVELIAVYVQDPSNESRPIPGVVVVVKGNTFTVRGLALSPTQRCEVVAVLSGALNAHKVSADITGTFEPAK